MSDEKQIRRPRGRPPGSKNKSTIERERAEKERILNEATDEIVEKVVKQMKDSRIVKDRGIKLKNHEGTFRVVKRKGDTVMLESEQYGQGAYNVILKGDKIIAERVDGYTDPRVAKAFHIRKASAEYVLDEIQDLYNEMDRICDDFASIEGTGIDDCYRDFVYAMDKVEGARDDLMDAISQGIVKSRIHKFSINGNGVYPMTDDNIHDTIHTYICDNEEGLKEYWGDEWKDDMRDILCERAVSEIMRELDYHMNQGDEIEYPEFGLTFYPDYEPDDETELFLATKAEKPTAKEKKPRTAKRKMKKSPQYEFQVYTDGMRIVGPDGANHDIPVGDDEDIWNAISRYDDANGTSLWDTIGQDDFYLKDMGNRPGYLFKGKDSARSRKLPRTRIQTATDGILDTDIEKMISDARMGKDLTGVNPDPDEPIPDEEPPAVTDGDKPDTDPDEPIPQRDDPASTVPGASEGNDIEALGNDVPAPDFVPPKMGELDIDLEEGDPDELEKMIQDMMPKDIQTPGRTQPFANNYRTVSMGRGKDVPIKRR